mmetsp:Transcript_841/g.2581  ORF Transcript_841/g.2581 Transcript_841/m.2581 type:complete len:244 (+) Transcript_841:1718-2449(+)
MRATSCTRFALISGPMRVAEAVRMMRPENVSRKSTSPSSAHSVAKYASASEMILGTIASSDRVFIECTTILICCCLSSSGESYTIFRPNTGMVNLYTGPWSSSLSVARMKERCASGPCMNVMRCPAMRIVKRDRYCERSRVIRKTGPRAKSIPRPRMGTPPSITGGISLPCAGSDARAGIRAWIRKSAAADRRSAGPASTSQGAVGRSVGGIATAAMQATATAYRGPMSLAPTPAVAAHPASA